MDINKVYKSVPFDHQKKALEEGKDRINFAYFMEMGTGKTKVAIDNANYLYLTKKINDVIVLAPNSVYMNWIQEISDHSKIKPDIFVWKKSKQKLLMKYKYNNFFWLLMNIESISRPKGRTFLEQQLNKRGNNTLLIVDESTTIKNKEANRTKALCKMASLAKYKRILTGSPVTKSPLDLYTQCQFLNKSLLGFKSFYAFRNRYAEMQEIHLGTHVAKVPKKFINLEELEFKLKNFSYRCTKDECLDLPYKMFVQRNVEITTEQKNMYEKLKKEARAIIHSDEVSFANKLTEIIKLHQVTCGFVKTNNGEVHKFDKNPKLKELASVLEETDEKSIIWATYVSNIEDIKLMLGEKYGKESVVSLYGKDSIDDRKNAVERFQNDNRCRFIVGNPAVGGYGLTLTAARNVIYFSNSYNLEHRQQSEDRAHRIGQTSNLPITYVDLIVPSTLDVLILKSLKTKKSLQHQIMGDQIKSYF